MPKSSRHKSHKQSKYSSKDYSDSEEDVKMKEKSSKDENSIRVHRDSASGEKRKISSQVREGKEGKDLSGHGNGEVPEEYVSSKRRKERADASVGGDRWNGGGEERGDADRSLDKENNKGESSKIESKSKDSSNKGEGLRIEAKSKSKKYESGSAGDRKEDSLPSVVVDKEESRSKGESKRKSERDSSARKEGRESKDKDRRSEKERNGEKEKNGVQEHKRADGDAKLVEIDIGKKQGSQSGDFLEEKQGKRTRENTERSAQDELRKLELEKDIEKKIRRRREGSNEKDKHYDDSREGDDRRISSRGERSKDVKYKDDKHKDGSYVVKYQDDSHRDERQRDEKYREDADKDGKHRDDKYREDGDKDSRRRDDRHREDGDRDKRKDDKHREDGERDSKRKDEKYRDGTEREGRHRDDRHHEKHREDSDKYIRRSDEKYQEDGDRDDRHKDSYRESVDKDGRHKEEKYQDTERDTRYKESKQGDDFDREKRQRDSKYRDERTTRDHSGDKSDPKRQRDDGYAADHYSRKSSAYDDSPTHDDRTARYRDDPGRRRPNEKEDYGDVRSRGTKDQRSDAEKKSAIIARMDLITDKGRSSSRNVDIEPPSGHSRRRSSPTPSSHVPRDHYRVPKQDDSKYRDYNYEERVRHNVTSSSDYGGPIGGSEKTSSSRSLEKVGPKDDGHLGELSAERRLKSDIRASPLNLVDKSPSSADRRQFSRSDVRRNIDVEESTQRSGSRDVKEYSGKEGRASRGLAVDVLPGDDFSQVDTDTVSVSSPFMRNNHFSSSSKSLPPPPPYRSGVDSPSLLGPAEDDSRGKSNNRHRRIGDPNNMARMTGNPWRGVPNWPSPIANGFLPFPHAPPPVGFHSVMQPFASPPMFSVRPSMELTHSSPYHMTDVDRFSGPGRPMVWRNQVDTWDGNAVFVDEPHIYRRPDWDHSGNMPSGRGWDSSADLWKGQNRTVSLEMQSSEKENNPTQNTDEALAVLSTQPAQSEQTRVDQQAESTEISQSTKTFEKNDVDAPVISLEETSDVDKMSIKDDVRLCDVYLSKLDISADLAEPEIFNQCTGSIDMDQSIFLDVDDSKIIYMEEAVEAEAAASHKILSYTVLSATDDSIFQKAMSLYKKQRGNAMAEDGEKLEQLSEFVPNNDQEDQMVEDEKTDNPCTMNEMQGVEDALPVDIMIDPQNSLQKVEGYEETTQENKDVPFVTSLTEKSEELVSALDHVEIEVNPEFGPGLPEPELASEEKPVPVESVERSDSPLLSEAKDLHMVSGGADVELKLLDTKCGALLNSDVSTEVEAMMPGSIVSGSVNLSRIHHSPESTH